MNYNSYKRFYSAAKRPISYIKRNYQIHRAGGTLTSGTVCGRSSISSTISSTHRISNTNRSAHIPVMLNEVKELLQLNMNHQLIDSCLKLKNHYMKNRIARNRLKDSRVTDRRYTIVDATFGQGGYSVCFLNEWKECHVIALDCDPVAFEKASQVQNDNTSYKNRFFPYLTRYSNINTVLEQYTQTVVEGNSGNSGTLVDAVVFDLGVSSIQIDQGERGFSFMKNGPLDMRMDAGSPTASPLTAFHVINTYSSRKLEKLISVYGEERQARKIAHSIVSYRESNGELRETNQLSKLIIDTIGYKYSSHHPATKTFQAIRIHVNQEMVDLYKAIQKCKWIIKPGGLLLSISFQSLEDRLVKRLFQPEYARLCKEYEEYDSRFLGFENTEVDTINDEEFDDLEAFVMDLIKPTPKKYTRMRWEALDAELEREKKEEVVVSRHDKPDEDEDCDGDKNENDDKDDDGSEDDKSDNEFKLEQQSRSNQPKFIMISKRVCIPTLEEISKNPRARSAKLRPLYRIE